MPKIIENLKSKLVEEAQKQVADSGYSAVTIRSVAKACGVGVGTVYNYFPSKDALLAAYLLEDWNQCVAVICDVSRTCDTPEPVIRCIYDQLLAYSKRHQTLFQDASAATGFSGSFSRYHGLLRAQIAAPIRQFCDSDFSAEFIAEAMLTWTMAGKPFDVLYGMINKLF